MSIELEIGVYNEDKPINFPYQKTPFCYKIN